MEEHRSDGYTPLETKEVDVEAVIQSLAAVREAGEMPSSCEALMNFIGVKQKLIEAQNNLDLNVSWEIFLAYVYFKAGYAAEALEELQTLRPHLQRASGDVPSDFWRLVCDIEEASGLEFYDAEMVEATED